MFVIYCSHKKQINKMIRWDKSTNMTENWEERFHWISLKVKLMFEANRSTNRMQDFILLVSQLGQFLSCVHVHSFSELKRRNEDLCTTTRSVKTEICRKQNSNSLRLADPGAKTADEPWFTQYMIGIYYFKKHTHLFNIITIQRCDLHSPTKSFLGRVSVEPSLDDVRLKSVKVTKTQGERQLSINSQLILNKLGKLNTEQCEETNKQITTITVINQ